MTNSVRDTVAPTPESLTEEVMNVLLATPKGRELVEKYGGKDAALTAFQQANDISEEIAEAAFKEWYATHDLGTDWDLEVVMATCLRNKREGIPFDYLPEDVKKRQSK